MRLNFFAGRLWMCVTAIGALTACSSETTRDAGVSSASVQQASVGVAIPGVAEGRPLDFVGLHNVVAYHEQFLSGGVPEGEAGFDTLAAMGVKTIISVDGAEPDVQAARAHGLRYIHLPIGYNGFDEQRKRELVRATRDAMQVGPVYIHCHHGKHRSAGAAGTVAVSLGWATADEMIDRMKVSGTAPSYKGLYACTSNAVVLETAAIAAVPADFPEISKPTSFVKGMVEMDVIVDHLKAIENAGWEVPADHPDLVPVAEAGRLADLFRVHAESDRSKNGPADFREEMLEANVLAQSLEDMLAAEKRDSQQLSAQLKLINASCKHCHVTFRD
jgi:protein tyrosine phosphatase (PTP) superfamily phosphohydrolase (DUF442 family)